LALVFGLCEGLVLSSLHVHNILSPATANPKSVTLTVNILFLFCPMLIESILMVRLAAVYPLRTVGHLKWCLILAPPILFKIGRIINAGFAIADLVAAGNNSNIDRWGVLAFAKVEWVLQLVDNSYASCLFLWRLRDRVSKPSENRLTGSVIFDQLQAIFYIAVSNFVLPCFMNLVQLIIVFIGPTRGDSMMEWFLTCTYIMMANNYLTIIGVVFATIWSSGNQWAAKNGYASKSDPSSGSGTIPQRSAPRTKNSHLGTLPPMISPVPDQTVFEINHFTLQALEEKEMDSDSIYPPGVFAEQSGSFRTFVQEDSRSQFGSITENHSQYARAI